MSFDCKRSARLTSVASMIVWVLVVSNSFGQLQDPAPSNSLGQSSFQAGSIGRSFSNAVIATNHPPSIPQQGPWTISDSDFLQPGFFTSYLVQHKEPIFFYLWNRLSEPARASLLNRDRELRESSGSINLGSIYHELVANELTAIINGGPIYKEGIFPERKLSGDTILLLAQNPSGAALARLNRLLLEDALPVDIVRRPKVIVDQSTGNMAFIDFKANVITMYSRAGTNLWTLDLGPKGPSILREQILDVAIWDADYFSEEILAVKTGVSLGRSYKGRYQPYSLKTGLPQEWPRR